MTDRTEATPVGAIPRHSRRHRGPVSFFEFWPGGVFYAPIVLQWAFLGLRYGNPFICTAANPMIESGGLCGESKSSILDQMAPAQRHWIAPYGTFVVTGDPVRDRTAAEATMREAGVAYPLVAKPDIGCNGAGIRIIRDWPALAGYCRVFPPGQRLMLQRLITDEPECGLFYVRLPGEATGRITSATLKSSPYVVGDGLSTLESLVRRDPRAGRLPHVYLPRLAGRLHDVPAYGERVRLVFTGNHCKGSIFRNGSALITPALTRRIEEIARAIPEFHFGRFDIRYRSNAELAEGNSFSIIEINGVGSEATHIWDRDATLAQAYRSQFEHYAAAFQIGAANRRRGFRPTPVRTLWRLWRRQKRLMAAYPISD